MSEMQKAPVSLKLPPDLAKQIEEIMTKTGWSQAESMRNAMRIGLEAIRRKNYSLAEAFLDLPHECPEIGGGG